jgi:transcriptional regulator GlxA family with amidase domain
MRVAIVVYPGLTALDAVGPYEVFNSAPGVEVRLVWKHAGPVLTDHGAVTLGATHTLADTTAAEVVIVPGSSANTGHAMKEAVLREWLVALHARTRFTASVCSGALVLGAAGLLRGLPATTHWAVMDSLPRFGAEPRPNERVVRAGRIVTAAGVSAGIDLGLALLGELRGPEEARAVQLAIEYDPQPPFDSGHVSKAPAAAREQALAGLLARGSTPRAWG